MTIQQARTWLSQKLSRYPHSSQLAWHLLSWALDKSQTELIKEAHQQVPQATLLKLQTALDEHLLDHKPLQYIIGSVPFLSATIKVRPPILIPRPETENWVAWYINQLKKLKNKKLTLLDMCTGSGCIAIALAQALPEATIYAVDISPEALALAKENAQANNCDNIIILQSDLFSKLPTELRFDAIVSNPPYVTFKEWETLEPVVTKWEDPQALKASEQGLSLIKKIIKEAPSWLTENDEFLELAIPQLVIEIGKDQASQVTSLMEDEGFRATSYKDDAGHDRIVCGELSNAKK